MTFDIRNPRDYDIMSALRGPDSASSVAVSAKHVTTSVIRSLAGMERNDRCIVYTPIEAAYDWSLATIQQRTDVMDFMSTNYHFESHFLQALSVLVERGTPGAANYRLWYYEQIRRPGLAREAVKMSDIRPGRFIPVNGKTV
jgi:hypothetical protein